MGHAIDADGSVLAGRGPAFVPVRLALHARVTVNAVARVCAAVFNRSVVGRMAADARERERKRGGEKTCINNKY